MTARTAVRVAVTVLAAGMAAPTLAGCAGGPGALQHRSNNYTISGQVQALVVNAHVGSISVIGGSAGQVTVSERIVFRHRVPVTTHRAAAGTLTLDSSCPALEPCSVGYDITVPPATAVRVFDDVGTVRLDSLSGQVTVHLNVGDINLGSVSGRIAVTDRVGSILGRGVSSARATLQVSAGQIDVAFSAAPAAIAASAGVGSVTLRVPGSVSYSVTAGVSVGSTEVGVSRNPASAHSIVASAGTGSVTIEPAR